MLLQWTLINQATQRQLTLSGCANTHVTCARTPSHDMPLHLTASPSHSRGRWRASAMVGSTCENNFEHERYSRCMCEQVGWGPMEGKDRPKKGAIDAENPSLIGTSPLMHKTSRRHAFTGHTSAFNLTARGVGTVTQATAPRTLLIPLCFTSVQDAVAPPACLLHPCSDQSHPPERLSLRVWGYLTQTCIEKSPSLDACP